MRRLARIVRRDERGAAALIVAVLMSFLLLGIGAVVLDVGNIFWERRQLQNSADAAALAVAMDCAGGDCGDYQQTATGIAVENNVRGANIPSVLPAGLSPTTGQVTVVARTGDPSGGESTLRHWLAPFLPDGSSESVQEARATVQWGAVSAATARLPLAVSLRDWQEATGGGGNPNDLPTVEAVVSEAGVRIPIHVPDAPGDAGKPGLESDVGGLPPPGFGLLAEEQVSGCEIDVAAAKDDSFWVAGTVNSDTVEGCLDAAVNNVVVVPIFVEFDGTGYLLGGPAAFYLTGYQLSEDPADTWIRGHFVRTLMPGVDPIDDIVLFSDFGVRAVKLIK
jgi:hypothetical protein